MLISNHLRSIIDPGEFHLLYTKRTNHYGASHPWSENDDGAFARAEKL